MPWARLHHSLGHLTSAAHWYRQNLDWARKAGDIPAQAAACFEMSELALTSNNHQAAAQAARDGLAKIQSAGSAPLPATLLQPLSGRGHRLLGAAYAMEGSDLAAAEYHVQAAVAVQRQLGNPVDLCAGLFELGNIAAQRGELQRALDLYDQSARAAESGRIYYYLALARNNYAYHSLLLGQIQAAQDSAATGIKIAEDNDLLAALLHLYSTQGEIHLYLAEWHPAEDSFRRGLALAEDLGNLERQAGYRGGLALAARGRGELEEGGAPAGRSAGADRGPGLLAPAHPAAALAGRTAHRAGALRRSRPAARGGGRRRPRTAAHAAARPGGMPASAAAGGGWGLARGPCALQGNAGTGRRAWHAVGNCAGAGCLGEASVRYSTSPAPEGREMVAAARAVLSAHDARADLARLG